MTTPNKIMFIDLETQVHEWYGRRASPRHPENYVVMHGQAIESDPYSGTITGGRYTERSKWLNIPDDVWLLVAHNAPFELDWMLVQQRDEIMRFLKRGGRIFCTAFGHYLVTNQQDTYPALDYVAPLYGGSHKVDGIKLLWDQGVQTSDIDPALLAEYLLGPEGDIENTRKVFYGVAAKLQERGMWDMALDRMEGMLAIIFAMDSGLYVNQEVAFSDLAKMEADYTLLQASFREARAALNPPAELEFKESSDFHMSAWLYGGPIKYRARVPALDAEGKQKYEKTDCYLFGTEAYIPVAHFETIPEGGARDAQFTACVQHYGNLDRYKAGKNKGQVKVHRRDDPSRPATKWGELLWQCPGLVNLGALPKEVRDEFKDTYTGARKLADGSPVYSTGAEPLELLSKRSEVSDDAKHIITNLLKFARLDKDIGTYYLRKEYDDEGNVVKVSGALQYVTPESIIHHVLNCTSTATGRLSATRPNMQNLPRGDEDESHTSRVKHMYTSRFGDEGDIVEIDYTALEVVTLAAFSQDPVLIDALLAGTDMHCLRLSKKLGEPYDSVYAKCHDKSHPEHRKYKEMRTHIKPPSFAYQYGATAFGIAFNTGMPLEEAEKFVRDEKELFPGVESFYSDRVIPTVESNVTRHREQMPDGSWRLYGKGTWVSPAGTTYEFRQYPKSRWVDGQKVELMEFKPTQIRNYPIQGESSFFVQGIAGLVIRWLIANDFFDGKVHFINTVHDALYFDVHKSVRDTVIPVLKQIMQAIPAYFGPKYGYTLNVPFPVEAEYGPSMAEKTAFKESA